VETQLYVSAIEPLVPTEYAALAELECSITTKRPGQPAPKPFCFFVDLGIRVTVC